MGKLVLHEAFGEKKTAKQWAMDRRCVLNYVTLLARFVRGWGKEAAIIIPIDACKKRYEAFGTEKNIVGWLADYRCKVPASVLLERLEQSKSFEQAITTPEFGRQPEVFRLKKPSHDQSAATRAKYVAFGEAKSLKAWSNDPRCKLSYHRLTIRIQSKMPFEAIIVFSADELAKAYYAFETVKKLASWLKDSRITIPASILKQRMESGERFESAVQRPPNRPLLKKPPKYGSSGKQRRDLDKAILNLQEEWNIAKLTIYGLSKTASQWSKDPRCEVSYPTIVNRMRGVAGR